MAWPEALLAENEPGIHQDGMSQVTAGMVPASTQPSKKLELGDRHGRTPVATPVPRDPTENCGVLQAAPEGDLVPYDGPMDSLVPLFSRRRIAE